jgi:hypothetical protein
MSSGNSRCPPGQQQCLPGSTPPFTCGCFGDTSATDGATTLARLYALESQGQLSGSTTGGIVANIVSYGYIMANVQCKEAYVAEQVIDFACNNELGPIVEFQNPSCDACKALAKQVADGRTQLEQDAHRLNPSYQIQVPDPVFVADYYGVLPNNSDGICRYVCLQCIIEDFEQDIQMKIVEDCAVDTPEFINAWSSGMSTQAVAELSNQQNALQSTGLQLKNKDNLSSLAIQVSDTIRQMTKVSMLNSLNANALLIQNTTISEGSTSVVLSNVTQSISLSMFASLVSQNYTDMNVQASIDMQAQQETIKIETSFADLIKQMENSVKTMDSLLVSMVGKIMITLVAILMLVLMVFASFFFFKPSFLFGGIVGDSNDDDSHEKT